MPDDLYERDILLWSEREAGKLRRLSRGEPVPEPVDWTHGIEELADVGLAELRAVESMLRQAMLHLLKLHADPDAAAAGHWRGEIVTLLGDAQDRCTASMRQRLDMAKLWRLALRAGTAMSPTVRLPPACPWTPDDLLAEDAFVAGLLARLG